MTSTFQQKLNEALLRSERKRTMILIGIFALALIIRFGLLTFFPLGEENNVNTFSVVWLFPACMLIFEIISFLHISHQLRNRDYDVPIVRQFLNAALEIALPSLIILIVANQYPQVSLLKSPGIMIYFIFIILSTLRLNPWISFFCGLLSSLAYISFSLFIYNQFYSEDLARALIFLLCGIASGLVAKQIRTGINDSLKETEKRHHVENIFGQQISAEVAQKMISGNGKIESKRMNVAIMFIDIRNFTAFAAGRDPEEIVQYQNSFFKLVINAVAKHHGIVHQFLGDGCMVTFGAPLDLENPSQNAVNASVELLREIDRAVQRNHLFKTRIGIGIHTGEAVTGNIGTDKRQQYSVTGNVVILASRIEQLNKQFGSQLLVSEEVYASVRYASYRSKPHGMVALKGWHKPISIYQLS